MAAKQCFLCFACGARYGRNKAGATTPALKDYHRCPACRTINHDECAIERAQTEPSRLSKGSPDGTS